jgi:hypothetical protein
VTLRCTSCGKEFPVKDYQDEIDEKTWEKISCRSSCRV